MRLIGTLLRLLNIFLNDVLPFKHAPTTYTLQNLLRSAVGPEGSRVLIVRDGVEQWVPARSEGYHSLTNRFRCAWLVFTGKADAVKWPEDQE